MISRNTCCETEGTSAKNYLIACLSMAAGAAIGATAMYFLDPNRGKVRRAHLIDQASSNVRKASHGAAGVAEDLLNRSKGAIAKVGAAFNFEGDIDDSIIKDRVRSLMGHAVHHAHGIDTDVDHGRVTLRGTLPESERRRLVSEVERVPGVKAVNDCLACQVPV